MTTEKAKSFGKKDLEKRLGALTVGEFLRVWRVTEELSLKDFGKLIGMSIPNLCDIEKGRKGVSPEKATQIAKALGVPEALLIRLSLEESLRAVGLNYRVNLKPAA
jgi:transcriptional regulator with XRE-family HTH domain